MRDALAQAARIIDTALDAGGRPCLTCSFQAEDVAVLHLLRARRPEIPVLFLETGYHFPEVLEYRDHLTRQWGLHTVSLRAGAPTLHPDTPSECCHQRKVEPLMAGLAGYDLWFTGLRREQSPTRANLQPDEQHRFPAGLTLRKVSPVYDWTTAEVFAYLAANDIPVLPLYQQGYTSIGCAPCTAKPAPGEHARAGRWGGNKLECGLHTVTIKEA
ncbi:MAG: phosphoadenylyl-sulfate reductase [Candidatus Solibacter usitatus]|nr:phosphoadenylyl-sulfate reductase [Candidatus Solibacter usitatus]